MYLVFCVFTSRPTFLLASNWDYVFSFMVFTSSPININNKGTWYRRHAIRGLPTFVLFNSLL